MIQTSRRLVVLLLAALALGTDVLLIREQPAAELVIEMQSSEASQAKVYFDTGAGFNERESSTHSILADAAVHRLAFPLPSKPVRSIRFDPLELTGAVQIRGVVVERPGTHVRLTALDSSRIIALNEIATISSHAGWTDVTIVEDARDPQLLLPINAPLEFSHSAAELFSRRNLRTVTVLLAFAGVLGIVIIRRPKLKTPAFVNRWIDRWTHRAADSNAFPFDRAAVGFYITCLVVFLLLAVVKFHGSSISVAGASYLDWTDVEHTPLLGTPKKVRSDEWSFHTPAILNQLYRKDRLSVNESLLGPGKAALLGNIPCWHFTQLFRPQFWGFFVLPAELGFAFYWQAKGLLLLTGVFTLVFLLTRSSPVSAICALWYFFSAYTQWGYSWPSLLPEMVGLFCWTISLTCYLTVGRNRVCLVLTAIACAACAINFALCAYPPHQVPLAIFGAAIVVGWMCHNWRAIRRETGLTTRLLCLVGCWAVLVGGILSWFYFDARTTLIAAANTVYPGQRSNPGGGILPAQFFSHFLDFWKSEDNFPVSQGNICEGSGYLWLAPLTLLVIRPPKPARISTPILVLSWTAFFLLLSWMLFPIPEAIGKWVGLNRVPPFRCYHALGLINIAILGIFLAEQTNARQLPHLVRGYWVRSLGATALLAWLLFRMNKSLDHFFPIWTLWVATGYVGLLTLFLVQGRLRLFGWSLLLPLTLANGIINPVDRGLGVITRSGLFRAVHEGHRDWREGKWMIFAPWAAEPGLLAATGIDVVSCLKIIPDRQRLAPFDPEGRYADVINRSSYFFALPVAADTSSFETPTPGNVLWRVNPLDSRLRKIGVTHIAAAYQPLPRQIGLQLAPYLETTMPGLQVYRSR